MKQYPLIKKLGLKTFDTQRMIGDVVRARNLEQLLQNATVVYTHEQHDAWYLESYESQTHKALLLAIEPIEQKKVTITRDDLENIFNKKVPLGVSAIDFLSKELGL